MSDVTDGNPEDRLLWQRLGRTKSPPAPAVDCNDLAAYLDGSAPQALQDLLDLQMTQDPALLQDVAELRQLASLEAQPVPPQMLARATALDPRPLKPVRRPRGQALSGWQRWDLLLRWPVAAAAIVVASVIGFTCGQGLAQGQHLSRTGASLSRVMDMGDSGSDALLGFTANGAAPQAVLGQGGAR